ncbi:MAG: ribonuclease H [Thermoproteota archaeon]|nr:MAG: ribonuclease H [Candidatus Korarchaeota archaeon]
MEVYIDGGCQGNPGPMRIAVAVPATGFSVVKELGNGTNNRAEYMALLYALIYVKHLQPKEKVVIKSESSLVVNQINAHYKVKSNSVKQLYQKATRLLQQLTNVTVEYIPREENRAGHLLE